eukprot:2673073-Heterocapsa_arctica.AAC.1
MEHVEKYTPVANVVENVAIEDRKQTLRSARGRNYLKNKFGGRELHAGEAAGQVHRGACSQQVIGCHAAWVAMPYWHRTPCTDGCRRGRQALTHCRRLVNAE